MSDRADYPEAWPDDEFPCVALRALAAVYSDGPGSRPVRLGRMAKSRISPGENVIFQAQPGGRTVLVPYLLALGL